MSFKKFPEFTVLTQQDKAEYEDLIKGYPPIADVSFAGLMGWWGLTTPPQIALIGRNIIIDYSLDGISHGLSIVGDHDIDEAICAIFDYQQERGQRPELVHVPDFVVDSMSYPELFDFKAERAYDEYIVPTTRFYPLENSSFIQKHRVMSFMNNLEGSKVSAGPLDLTQKVHQQELIKTIAEWPKKGINNLSEREQKAMESAIVNADSLGLKNACLYINDELHGFMLFDAPSNSEYLTIEYMRISYAMPHLLNYCTYIFAEWAYKSGVRYANLCMDYGKPVLRVVKLSLNPVNFFRKYTIEPAHITALDKKPRLLSK